MFISLADVKDPSFIVLDDSEDQIKWIVAYNRQLWRLCKVKRMLENLKLDNDEYVSALLLLNDIIENMQKEIIKYTQDDFEE